MSSSDSGVENSNSRAALEEPVEALLAQFEQVIAQRLGVVGRASAATGNSAYQREPSGCASIRAAT